MPYTRLCKIVFDELTDSQSHPMCDYLNNVRRVLENAGLDHYLNSDVNMITFKKIFGEYVRNREIINAKSKSSKLRPLPYHVWKTVIPIKFSGVPTNQI